MIKRFLIISFQCCLLGFAFPVVAAEILVFSASSTTEALTQVAQQFQYTTHHRIKTSFAGSGLLARQIEAGAPASVFISAHPDWMNYLQKRGHLVEGSRVNLLQNRLVLVAPKTASFQGEFPASLPEWLAEERLSVADPDHVPAGIYARAALLNLGLWASLQTRLARASNVRIALLLVERGEAPLGIVYATDAQASSKVKVIATFPPASHPPIVYPAALIKHQFQKQPDDVANSFLNYLRGKEAQRVLEAHGFMVPQWIGGN